MSRFLPSIPKEEVEGESGLRKQAAPKDISPRFRERYFTCPRCRVASWQHWLDLFTKENKVVSGSYKEVTTKLADVSISTCGTCSARSLWFEQTLIFPVSYDAPPMSPDMPQELQRDYEEAAAVSQASPRAAAALLRMCIEGLCKKLSGAGTFEKAVEWLDEAGCPREIQLALDIIRQNGNEVMHAGQLYGNDDNATVAVLFRLANSVVSWAITEKRQLEDLYNQIPEDKRKALEARRTQRSKK